MAGKKSFIWNFLTAVSMVGFLGLSACNKANTVNATADASNIKGEGQAKGCASDQLKDDKLCQLVLAGGEGNVNTLFVNLPKASFENEFDKDGFLRASKLFSEKFPDRPAMVTEQSYSQGRADHRTLKVDLNPLDDLFTSVSDTNLIQYDNMGRVESELGQITYPGTPNFIHDFKVQKQYSDPGKVKTYFSVNSANNVVDLFTVEELENNGNGYPLHFSRKGWAATYTIKLPHEEIRNSYDNEGRLSQIDYNIINCYGGFDCFDPNTPGYHEYYTFKTTFDYTQEGKITATTETDGNFFDPINGEPDGTVDFTSTCIFELDLKNSSKISYFPPELYAIGLRVDHPISSITCKDSVGTEGRMTLKWAPLWQAAGLAEPVVAGSGVH